MVIIVVAFIFPPSGYLRGSLVSMLTVITCGDHSIQGPTRLVDQHFLIHQRIRGADSIHQFRVLSFSFTTMASIPGSSQSAFHQHHRWHLSVKAPFRCERWLDGVDGAVGELGRVGHEERTERTVAICAETRRSYHRPPERKEIYQGRPKSLR